MARGFVYQRDEGTRRPALVSGMAARLPLRGDLFASHVAGRIPGGMRANVERHVEGDTTDASRRSSQPPDGFGDRLVKYVPAEVLAFFIVAAGQWGSSKAFLIVTLAIAAVFTPIVLYSASPAGLRWYSVLLAVLAFFAWAIGTSAHTDRLLSLSGSQGPFVLTVAAFAIPALDTALGKALRAEP